MAHFIDRRLNGKNKSTLNRQRFIRRYKKQIKKAVSEAINKRSVTDISSGESISIPQRDISEPTFHQGKGGTESSFTQVTINFQRAIGSSALLQGKVVGQVMARQVTKVKDKTTLYSLFQKTNT